MGQLAKTLFGTPDLKTTTDFVTRHFPKGRAWGLKNEADSNIRKLIKSLASGFRTIQQQIEELAAEFDINQSILLLPDWEKSVGLPDQCLGSLTDLTKRRNEVILRLRKIPIVTLSEFQLLVDELFPGQGITLYPGREYYTFEYEFSFTFIGQVNERFILVVEIPESGTGFEYEFEITFEGGIDTNLVICVLERIIPANVVLSVEFVQPIPPTPPQTITLIGGDGSTLLGGDGSRLLGGDSA